MKVKSESEVAQSCPTLSDLMDCNLPGSSVPGNFQARVLEWGAIATSNLFYTQYQQCIYINPNLPIHPTPLSSLGVHSFVLYVCVSISSLVTIARTSKTMLNKSGESVPDLRGNAFTFSPLSMMLTVGLSYMAFIMLR